MIDFRVSRSLLSRLSTEIKIVFAVSLEIAPRHIESNYLGSHFGDQSDIDLVGIAATMGIDTELGKIPAAARSLQFDQPFLKVSRGRHRPHLKCRDGQQKSYQPCAIHA